MSFTCYKLCSTTSLPAYQLHPHLGVSSKVDFRGTHLLLSLSLPPLALTGIYCCWCMNSRYLDHRFCSRGSSPRKAIFGVLSNDRGGGYGIGSGIRSNEDEVSQNRLQQRCRGPIDESYVPYGIWNFMCSKGNFCQFSLKGGLYSGGGND